MSETLQNTTQFRAERKRRLPMMHISRKAAPDIPDSAFRILRRIAVLTSNGRKSCQYTNKQAGKELKISSRTVERCFSLLSSKGYITMGRALPDGQGYGRAVRTVNLTTAFKAVQEAGGESA